MGAINLQEQFGKRYRVVLEESWQHEPEGSKEAEKPWSMEMRGRRGFVYPGGDYLVANTETYPAMRALQKMGLELMRHGQNEACFRFEPAQMDAVAKVLGLRKRRQMTPEQLEMLAKGGRRFHFKPVGAGQDAQKRG